jgi:hypothetical protein
MGISDGVNRVCDVRAIDGGERSPETFVVVNRTVKGIDRPRFGHGRSTTRLELSTSALASGFVGGCRPAAFEQTRNNRQKPSNIIVDGRQKAT